MRTLFVLILAVLCGLASQAQEPQAPRPVFEVMAASAALQGQGDGAVIASSSRVLQDASGRSWLINEPAYLNESHIKSASLSPNPLGLPGYPRYALRLSLTTEGQRLLHEASASLVGKHMAILLNGRLASVAVVRSELNSHALELSTNAFTDQELAGLAHAF
jgi:preprotein translocase subunit SecD